MKNVCLLALCGFVAGTLMARVQPAFGVDAFKKAFDAKYVKKEPGTDAEKSLTASVEKVKCNVCHAGKSKKMHNDYGKALKTLLKKSDAKNSEKIEQAFETVAGMKSKSDDASSPTFGDLIQQGKLPGGDEAPTTTAEK